MRDHPAKPQVPKNAHRHADCRTAFRFAVRQYVQKNTDVFIYLVPASLQSQKNGCDTDRYSTKSPTNHLNRCRLKHFGGGLPSHYGVCQQVERRHTLDAPFVRGEFLQEQIVRYEYRTALACYGDRVRELWRQRRSCLGVGVDRATGWSCSNRQVA